MEEVRGGEQGLEYIHNTYIPEHSLHLPLASFLAVDVHLVVVRGHGKFCGEKRERERDQKMLWKI